MQEKIIVLLAEIKKDPALAQSLGGDSHLMNDAGLDSLQLIQFILRAEEEFDIEVDFDTFNIEHLQSVDRFAAFISSCQEKVV